MRLTDQAAVGAEQSAERLRRARAAEVPSELLTVYAAMSSGFHPREVLTPVWAGRPLRGPTYKHRVVTADLPAHTDEAVSGSSRPDSTAGRSRRPVRTYVDVHHPDMGSVSQARLPLPDRWGLGPGARAATSAGRRLRGVGRHREEDKGD